MTRGRMHYIDAEPCSIGADTVVALLNRIGWREAADLVERISERATAQNREAERWRRAYDELREKYEPTPAPSPRVSYQPPPEASD